jgi:uncharacterized protein YecT (DUF1311 family)
MQNLTAAALITLLSAGPIFAQDAQVDESLVRHCHASTPTGATYPECLGQASNACQAQPGGSSTLGIVACIQAETTVWDQLLNTEYKATQAANAQADARSQQANINRVKALRDAQRAWISFRDADCNARYALWQDGTIRSVVAANCHMVMTASRAIDLRDMRGN